MLVIRTLTQVDVEFIDSVIIEADGVSVLEDADAILVPGGFGERGFEGESLSGRILHRKRIFLPRYLLWPSRSGCGYREK